MPPTLLSSVATDNKLDSFLGAVYQAFPTGGTATTSLPGAPSLTPDTFLYGPNVTLFIPRNAAMSFLGPTLSSLSSLDLKRMASYHLVPGRILGSDSLTNGSTLLSACPAGPDGSKSQLNVPLHITRTGNGLYVNSARVVASDILLSNGVLHILDNVLFPDASESRPDPALPSQPPVWPVPDPASQRGGTPFTSALPCTTQGRPTTSTDAATARRTSSRTMTTSVSKDGAAAPAAARCTGHVQLAMAGVVGLGLGVGLAIL